MRVVPVPDEIRHQPWVLRTAVFAAPNGDLTSEIIPPAEGIYYRAHPTGAPEGDDWIAVGVVVLLDDADVELIVNGNRHIMLGWPGERMPVFMVPEILEGIEPK